MKVKINAQSTWNGGPMLRTELLPQTTSSLSGHLYFHVSLQIPTVNPPGTYPSNLPVRAPCQSDLRRVR